MTYNLTLLANITIKTRNKVTIQSVLTTFSLLILRFKRKIRMESKLPLDHYP